MAAPFPKSTKMSIALLGNCVYTCSAVPKNLSQPYRIPCCAVWLLYELPAFLLPPSPSYSSTVRCNHLDFRGNVSQWLTPSHSRMGLLLRLVLLLLLLLLEGSKWCLPLVLVLVGVSPEPSWNDRLSATIFSICFHRRQLHAAARHPASKRTASQQTEKNATHHL